VGDSRFWQRSPSNPKASGRATIAARQSANQISFAIAEIKLEDFRELKLANVIFIREDDFCR
jgi:hypothetical protein